MSETQRRQRRKTLTDKMVASLPRKKKRYVLADPELRGMYVRVPPQGPAVFAVVARNTHGKQIWATLGTADVFDKIEQAREQAREAIRRIKAGLTPFAPPPVPPDSFAAVAEGWLKRHVEAKGLRTGDELQRVLEKYALPHWRDRVFVDLRRSDVARLLDAIEDAHGHWVADSVLSVLRSLSSWYASRNDDYTPPFTRNMRRTPAQARKRSRMLSDDELRAVWRAAETAGTFGAFVMLLLLTAQRREKVVAMKWSDVADDGTWTIATAAREKGNAAVLRLPPAALQIIAQQPRLAGNPYVFAGRGNGAISGFSWRLEAFKASCGVSGFHLHDLRRTARSLMAKAGVSSEHAERVLGHAIGGVEGVYDVHRYDAEKADALQRLARLIERIVDGDGGKNVVPLRAAAVQP
jgi:integrase